MVRSLYGGVGSRDRGTVRSWGRGIGSRGRGWSVIGYRSGWWSAIAFSRHAVNSSLMVTGA